jgi:hypothetical protein
MRSRLEARLAEMFTQLGLELVLRASGLRRLDPGLRYRPRLQAGPGRREAIYVLRRVDLAWASAGFPLHVVLWTTGRGEDQRSRNFYERHRR